MPVLTAVAAGDPDEPGRPMSATRPDHLRLVPDVLSHTSASGAHLLAHERAELAAFVRARIAVLDALDPDRTPSSPAAVVQVASGDVAALVQLARWGPVELHSDGVCVAVLNASATPDG